MFYKAGIKVAARRTFGDVNAMSANTRQSGQWAGAGRELLCADDVSQTDGKRSADNTPHCGICRASTAILRTLDLFRKTPVHAAIVVDEFGALQGIVTRTDLLEPVAGDLPIIDAPARPKVTRRDDGSYLIDASVPFLDVIQLIGMSKAPTSDYVTLAGFILSQLHEMPKPGDHVVWAGWRFEVVDVDGRRIDMILAQREAEHGRTNA